MPYPLYQRHQHGELLSSLTHALEVLQKYQLHVLRALLPSLCVLAVTMGVLFGFHFAFLLLLLPAVLLTYAVPVFVSNKATPALRQEPRLLGRLGGFLQVAFAAHGLLRFKGARAVKRRMQAIADAHYLNQARKWLILYLSHTCKVTFNLLSALTVLWGGGTLYLMGAIELSQLITVYFLVALVTPRLDEMYRIYVYGQSLHASYEVLDELLDGGVEPLGEGPVGVGPGPVKSLRLAGVGFRYRPEGPDVLTDVNLEVQRGQRYAMTGGSGSGKSTLVDLLLGLLSPSSGTLLVNHQPLAPHERPAFWRRVSLHDQSNFVFVDRSAETNLALAEPLKEPGPDWAGLAKRLGLPQWGGHPAGLLSGGERQRLCLLRTLARKADVYVFDEPTSALDELNASAVMDAILSIEDAIVIVVTHDARVLHRFERILHVGAGQVSLVDGGWTGQEGHPSERR